MDEYVSIVDEATPGSCVVWELACEELSAIW